MARLFGTDGVRGLANGDVLTPELALPLARSAARELLRAAARAGRPRSSSAATPGPSGPMLEAAAAAGFASAGCDVAAARRGADARRRARLRDRRAPTSA